MMKRFQKELLALLCAVILCVMASALFAQERALTETAQNVQEGQQIFYQPVKFISSDGVRISIATDQAFPEAQLMPQAYGFQVLKTYRLCVTGVPLHPSVTLYPTIQVLDRTFPPLGQEWDYPAIVEISVEDLQAAIQGKFVTRVVYLENPDTALPVQEVPGGQGYFDVPQDANPIAIAKTLGRPIAILRMGGRGPSADGSFDDSFLFGCPAYLSAPVGK